MDQCSNCGTEIGRAANFCTNCGAALGVAEATVTQTEIFEPVAPAPTAQAEAVRPVKSLRVEDHLIKSIIATMCCCAPFGIVGIVYASKVSALLRRGDLAAAKDAGEKANLWSNVSIGVGFLLQLLVTLLTIIRYREGML